eukprot:c12169_g1_i3.p1 GENE.c12169_g1_i3~~c12169_g1_i3.p1  ORF type:complete len:539 (+),score=84.80 c12169_g1_i3:3-1619(+)
MGGNHWKNPYTHGGPFSLTELRPNADMQEHVDDYFDHRLSQLLPVIESDIRAILCLFNLISNRVDLHNTRLNGLRKITATITRNAGSYLSQIALLTREQKETLYEMTTMVGEEGLKALHRLIDELDEAILVDLLPENLGDVFQTVGIAQLLVEPTTRATGEKCLRAVLKLANQTSLDETKLEALGKNLRDFIERGSLKPQIIAAIDKELYHFFGGTVERNANDVAALAICASFLWHWSPCFPLMTENVTHIMQLLNGQFVSLLPSLGSLTETELQNTYRLMVQINDPGVRQFLLKCLASENKKIARSMFGTDANSIFGDLQIQTLLSAPETREIGVQFCVQAATHLKLNLINPYFQLCGFDATLDLLQTLEAENQSDILASLLGSLDIGAPKHVTQPTGNPDHLSTTLLRLENWYIRQTMAQLRQTVTAQSKTISDLRALQMKVDRQAEEINLIAQRQSEQLSQAKRLQEMLTTTRPSSVRVEHDSPTAWRPSTPMAQPQVASWRTTESSWVTSPGLIPANNPVTKPLSRFSTGTPDR